MKIIKTISTLIFVAFAVTMCGVIASSSDDNEEESKIEKSVETTTEITTTKEVEVTTTAARTEATEPTTEPKLHYNSGMYKVGVDMIAGEYMLIADFRSSGYMCDSSDANSEDIIFNDLFETNSIATFFDGEYVKLSDCTAYPIEDMSGDVNSYILNDAKKDIMYKIGTNLPAGEYNVICNSSEEGYYCIYSDSRQDDIVSNDIFEGNSYINVSDGQYLRLERCEISQ